MSLSKYRIRKGIDTVAGIEPAIAKAVAEVGYPPTRIRPKGYATLLRALVGQQVSVASANSVWLKLTEFLGADWMPESLLQASPEELRSCGLSKQKQGYARSLSEVISSGSLDLQQLPNEDDEAVALLVEVKGIGRWTAEVYLLFAEGRPNIWPAGDLAVQKAIGDLFELADRPDENAVRQLAEEWQPHRGSIAILLWHYVNNRVL